jgi:hypothetical protein
VSTLAYAQVEKLREAAPAGTSTTTAAPKTRTWLDVVVALVPAEVLAVHAFVISEFTKTSETTDADGEAVTQTVIENESALQWAFWLLIFAAVALYLIQKKGTLGLIDVVKAAIPAFAFVLWTMLQQNTAFDAVVSDIDEGVRTVVAVVGAVLLGALAQRLGVKSDKDPAK